MYKCNAQRDISEFQKFAIWKNRKRGYTIRKVETIDITPREALILWEALGQFLGKPDYKKEMEEEKDKFIGSFSCHEKCTNGKDTYHEWNMKHDGKCFCGEKR